MEIKIVLTCKVLDHVDSHLQFSVMEDGRSHSSNRKCGNDERKNRGGRRRQLARMTSAMTRYERSEPGVFCEAQRLLLNTSLASASHTVTSEVQQRSLVNLPIL